MTREEYATRLAKIADYYGEELLFAASSVSANGSHIDLMGSDPVLMRQGGLKYDADALAKLAAQMSKDLANAEKEFKQP